MTYCAFLSIGGKIKNPTNMGTVGTVKGWGDLGRWIDTLKPAANFEGLHHMRQHGWNRGLDEMERQLADAVQSQPPHDKSVLKTAKNLLRILRKRKDAEYLTIEDETD